MGEWVGKVFEDKISNWSYKSHMSHIHAQAGSVRKAFDTYHGIYMQFHSAGGT